MRRLLLALVAGLAIGVLISIVQAATQVNEVTLVFIPKMLGAGVVLLRLLLRHCA